MATNKQPENKQFLLSRARVDAVLFELESVVPEAVSGETAGRAAQGSVRLIQALRGRGYRTAVVTMRRDDEAVLSRAGLESLFDACVNASVTGDMGLREMKARDAFSYAARLMQVPPRRCAVVAGTLASVDAARAGGFGLILALSASGAAEGNVEHGADSVLADLGEVSVAELDCRPRRAADLPSGLAALPQLLRTSKDGLLLLLDYDGTLTPIVERPELAVLAPETRAILTELVAIVPVAVVSGRGLRVLRELVDVPGLVYVGDHGFDMAGLESKAHSLEAVQDYLPMLDAVERDLRAGLGDTAGTLFERKRFSLAVHFRLVAAADLRRVQAWVHEVLAQHPQLKTLPGKKVIEIQPGLDWDKGKAVEWLLPQMDASGRRHPIYIGDDRTDENAFRIVCRRGTGILVRDDDHSTTAHYALEDPGEVQQFLQQLTQSLKSA